MEEVNLKLEISKGFLTSIKLMINSVAKERNITVKHKRYQHSYIGIK